MAVAKGFKQIMIASNGKNIAENPELLKELRKAGLSTIYLQFDGMTQEPYIKARGFNALPLKLKVIEHVRALADGPTIVLVPTTIKGVNDRQIGEMIRFAANNIDVVKGINFQPVSFTGRIDRKTLKERRITIPDVLKAIEQQTSGKIKVSDFYSIPSLVPILDFLKNTKSGVYPELSTHPVCGAGTYVFVEGDELIPITRMINVDEFINLMMEIRGASQLQMVTNITLRLPKLIKIERLRQSKDLIMMLKDILLAGSFESAVAFHSSNLLFIGIMHFMDLYNFDCERIERCCIHYATPDGRIMPFCTYNTIHRSNVEKRFAKPMNAQRCQ
jgi:uncharacterized radical SAM superfamily Fe-S cluster-containing enzyme